MTITKPPRFSDLLSDIDASSAQLRFVRFPTEIIRLSRAELGFELNCVY